MTALILTTLLCGAFALPAQTPPAEDTERALRAQIDLLLQPSPVFELAYAWLDANQPTPSERLHVVHRDCRNGTMNSHMLKALKATDHPQITFRMDSYDLAPAGAGMAGTLRVQ